MSKHAFLQSDQPEHTSFLGNAVRSIAVTEASDPQSIVTVGLVGQIEHPGGTIDISASGAGGSKLEFANDFTQGLLSAHYSGGAKSSTLLIVPKIFLRLGQRPRCEDDSTYLRQKRHVDG